MLDKMKFLLVFLTFFSFPLLAELAPDELVRKTADDVIVLGAVASLASVIVSP